MKEISKYLFAIIFLFGCSSKTEIEKLGKHYQKNNDYESLSKVVELMKSDADTAYVKGILGDPINMGSEYRYLIDSVGTNGCRVGAVFHFKERGMVDHKWIDEICE